MGSRECFLEYSGTYRTVRQAHAAHDMQSVPTGGAPTSRSHTLDHQSFALLPDACHLLEALAAELQRHTKTASQCVNFCRFSAAIWLFLSIGVPFLGCPYYHKNPTSNKGSMSRHLIGNSQMLIRSMSDACQTLTSPSGPSVRPHVAALEPSHYKSGPNAPVLVHLRSAGRFDDSCANELPKSNGNVCKMDNNCQTSQSPAARSLHTNMYFKRAPWKLCRDEILHLPSG